MSYGLAFAAIAAVIFHTILFHGQELWIQARAIRGSLDDNHTKMMRKYKEVPWWWYGILLVVMTGMSFGCVCGWPTHLSWWALLIGLLISLVWTIPIGIIYATTNIHLGLNVFTEYIIGYMQPGRPVASKFPLLGIIKDDCSTVCKDRRPPELLFIFGIFDTSLYQRNHR